MIGSLRPSSRTPPYPFYHNGPHLEEFFFEHANKEGYNRTYIDAFWTNIYSNRSFAGINDVDVQSELDKLDPNGAYFTVCQNDDGVLERLPKNTLKFMAGGNNTDELTIPIPLLASPIQGIDLNVPKDLLASFVGSNTHPLRAEMHKALRGKDGVSIQMKNWALSIPEQSSRQFMELSSRSKFMLAPRGYGKTSFRLYEAFQFDCVPVYISDSLYLPYQDAIDWNDYAVLVSPDQVKDLGATLNEIVSNGTFERMLNNIRQNKHLFTMGYMVEYIENKLK